MTQSHTTGSDEQMSAMCFLDWLREEVSAIDCAHRGDPSYDHDAFYMKSKVLGLIDTARATFKGGALSDERIKQIALEMSDAELAEVIPFARAIERAALSVPTDADTLIDLQSELWRAAIEKAVAGLRQLAINGLNENFIFQAGFETAVDEFAHRLLNDAAPNHPAAIEPVAAQAMTDGDIIVLAADFKSTSMACGVLVEDFDAIGFARALLASHPSQPAAGAQGDAPIDPPGDNFGSAEHWKEKAQYWAAEAHKLRREMLTTMIPKSQLDKAHEALSKWYSGEFFLPVIPEARTYTEAQRLAVTEEWSNGWDACRKFARENAPALASAQPIEQKPPISQVKHEVRQMLYQGYSIGINHYGQPLLLKDGETVAIINEEVPRLSAPTLYAAPQRSTTDSDVRDAVNAALEEAAYIATCHLYTGGGKYAAKEIRALKSSPSTGQAGERE